METLVARGDECSSACALAFLGGTSRYATGISVKRRLEFGATLGFHGFSFPKDSYRMEGETLSGFRIASAIILVYARKMTSVDLGWLAQMMNVPPEQVHYVRNPADIAALSIFLEGGPQGRGDTMFGKPSFVLRDWLSLPKTLTECDSYLAKVRSDSSILVM